MDTVSTLPPDRGPPSVHETENQNQLNAEAEKRYMESIRASQRHQEDKGCHTKAVSPETASLLLVPTRYERFFDCHGGAEGTQLTRPVHQEIDRPEQRHNDNS
jgi:hypothetical protein